MPPVIRDDPGLMENGFVAFRARHLVGVVVVFEDDVVGQLRDDARFRCCSSSNARMVFFCLLTSTNTP